MINPNIALKKSKLLEMPSNTQLTKLSNFKKENILFLEPQVAKIPNSTLTYKRIPMQYKNKNQTVGDFVLQVSSDEIFSYGVQLNKFEQSQGKIGYSMALLIGPNSKFEAALNDVKARAKQYLIENCVALGKKKTDMEFYCNKWRLVWYKRDKETDEIVEGSSPTYYAKLIYSQKNSKIVTNFYDMDNKSKIDPLNILDKYCHVKAAIKVESIFVGKEISLQIKLYEAEVRLVDSGLKRLISTDSDSDSDVDAEAPDSTDEDNY